MCEVWKKEESFWDLELSSSSNLGFEHFQQSPYCNFFIIHSHSVTESYGPIRAMFFFCFLESATVSESINFSSNSLFSLFRVDFFSQILS